MTAGRRHGQLQRLVLGRLGDLEAWAHANNVRWYSDEFTGRTMNRPVMNRLLADIRAGKIKTLVVWRLDRLARNAKGLHDLFDELTSRKVNFISLRDAIDLSTTTGRLLAGILATLAVWETELRAERVEAGLKAKRKAVAKGDDVWYVGRPKGTGKPIKAADEVREQVKAMKADKKPIAQIARVVKLSRQTVYAILGEAI
jgi:DNA invertase Pin-like site-specific DNA recombinase